MIAMTTSNSMSVKARMEAGYFRTEGNEDNEGGAEEGGDGFRGARTALSATPKPRATHARTRLSALL
jgi:hypothetical protein